VENGKIRKRGEEEEDDDEEEQQNINFRLMTPAINESTIFLGTVSTYQSLKTQLQKKKRNTTPYSSLFFEKKVFFSFSLIYSSQRSTTSI
jgi:hypothetical protein